MLTRPKRRRTHAVIDALRILKVRDELDRIADINSKELEKAVEQGRQPQIKEPDIEPGLKAWAHNLGKIAQADLIDKLREAGMM